MKPLLALLVFLYDGKFLPHQKQTRPKGRVMSAEAVSQNGILHLHTAQ